MQLPDANVRSSSYYIAEMQVRCVQCRRPARVLALALPPNHEMLVDGEWQKVDADAFIFYVAELPDSVTQHLLELSADFRLVSADGPGEPYWANHCENCGCSFSDDELHCEPGGFMPSQVDDAEAISLLHLAHEFSAIAAGYALAPEFFASMRRR